MKFFQNILALVRGVLLLLSMVVYLIGYALTRIFYKHSKESSLRLRTAWIKQMAYPILNLDVKVKGEPLNSAALYLCNHRSFVDPIVISKYVEAFVIAKAEVGNYPLINKGAEVTGVIYVKREDKGSRTNARKEFVDVIKSGHNILVYPEGTISTVRRSLPFKKGTFFEAAKEDMTIVPVAIEFKSKRDLWLISNLLLQYLNSFGKWKTEVKLTFGPPIKGTDGEALAQSCEEWVNQEMERMQEGWSEKIFEDVNTKKIFH